MGAARVGHETHWCVACKRWLEQFDGKWGDRRRARGGHRWSDYTCGCRCEDRIEETTCGGPVLARADAEARGVTLWTAAFPPPGMAHGARYLVRGHGDPEDAAIRVRLEMVHRTGAEMAENSVLRPLRYSNAYDLVDDGGNRRAFERRPLHEMEGALWRRAPSG